MAFVGSKALHRAMEVLTENEQAAIRLIICRGLSYDQAARSLGVSVSTINNWKHRGVKKLRRVIDEARLESSERGDGGGDHST
jgi:RNA polymerase sigma factor (sigma-70 family)